MVNNAQVEVIRFADLRSNQTVKFDFSPTDDALKRAATELDLLELRKLRLIGTLEPVGKSDWKLSAELGATAIQPCSVTLAPVTTRVDAPVLRQYLSTFELPTETEAEMPEDDTTEPLPAEVNLLEIALEALALVLPDYPRAEGASLTHAQSAPTGVAPLKDEDLKPFAGLAALKERMGDTSSE